MRAIYHRFDGIFDWNEGASINLLFQERPPSCLFTSELKNWRLQLSKDEKAEYLTKTERKKCKNMQNIIARWLLSTFKEYLEEKTSDHIQKPDIEIGKSLEESLRGGKLVIHLRPAPGNCGAFARLVSPGGGAFANFPLPWDRAFANPRATPELLTRTRFPIRI